MTDLSANTVSVCCFVLRALKSSKGDQLELFFFCFFCKKKEKKRHNLSMAFTGQLVFVVSEASGLEPPMVTGNQYVLFPSIISPLRKKECVSGKGGAEGNLPNLIMVSKCSITAFQSIFALGCRTSRHMCC